MVDNVQVGVYKVPYSPSTGGGSSLRGRLLTSGEGKWKGKEGFGVAIVIVT